MSPAHALNGHDATSFPAAPTRPETAWQAADPVLAALRAARDRRDQADRDIRILLAYARELANPRPYRLADLADATGRSISGVRTAYAQHDVGMARHIMQALGPPRPARHAPPGTAAMTYPARPPERLSSVNNPLTLNRRGRLVENDEYAAFARRVLRAYARRVADGDVETLTLMLGLSAEIDSAISQAVTGLREFGYSWAEIGSQLGITRQAAQQRWGRAS